MEGLSLTLIQSDSNMHANLQAKAGLQSKPKTNKPKFQCRKQTKRSHKKGTTALDLPKQKTESQKSRIPKSQRPHQRLDSLSRGPALHGRGGACDLKKETERLGCRFGWAETHWSPPENPGSQRVPWCPKGSFSTSFEVLGPSGAARYLNGRPAM